MKSVLIVDDSIAVARQLEKIVNSDDEFEVVGQGRNGAEAIKLCQQHKPEIVCMDMNMPVMDGLTALRNLMQLNMLVPAELSATERMRFFHSWRQQMRELSTSEAKALAGDAYTWAMRRLYDKGKL